MLRREVPSASDEDATSGDCFIIRLTDCDAILLATLYAFCEGVIVETLTDYGKTNASYCRRIGFVRSVFLYSTGIVFILHFEFNGTAEHGA